ncbi:hypothetical protein AB0M95_30135 [Sphaerisporangium sp. NPDC051017]|uniref:hypothetical protein n=1 Tax=Sphaerisporangium sp. NPDC051017 TaxID=3154636 RepID=UPI00341DF7F7
MLVVRGRGEPVLYLVRADGRKVAILAVQQGGTWLFVWGPNTGIRADWSPGLIRTIAQAAA